MLSVTFGSKKKHLNNQDGTKCGDLPSFRMLILLTETRGKGTD